MSIISLHKSLRDESCELKRALASIDLSFPCEYNTIIDNSYGLFVMGSIDVALNGICFLLILYFGWKPLRKATNECKNPDIRKIFTWVFIVFVSIAKSELYAHAMY